MMKFQKICARGILMEYEDEKSLVCRTKYNLSLYRKYKSGDKSKEFEYEVTQLINSFLGLVVFVKEVNRDQSIVLEKFVTDNFPDQWTYVIKKKQEEYNFENYLKHIRNAISHPNEKLIVNASNKDITSITFKDYNDSSDIFKTTLSLEKIDQLIELLSNAFFGNDICSENGKMNE